MPPDNVSQTQRKFEDPKEVLALLDAAESYRAVVDRESRQLSLSWVFVLSAIPFVAVGLGVWLTRVGDDNWRLAAFVSSCAVGVAAAAGWQGIRGIARHQNTLRRTRRAMLELVRLLREAAPATYPYLSPVDEARLKIQLSTLDIG